MGAHLPARAVGTAVTARWVRPFVARCSCGWADSCATEAGAQLLADAHRDEHGAGHVTQSGSAS